MDSNPKYRQFFNSLADVKGIDLSKLNQAHLSGKTPVSLRLNPFKPTDLSFPLLKNVPWCEEGYHLAERPVFTADPLFHAGCYYVQEASSMFLNTVFMQLVDRDKSLNVLDVCAAPGGKSTLIASLLNNNSVLVSNEIIKSRADVLAYNLAKWGMCQHIVTCSDTKAFEEVPGLFDVLVIDAPCSGSGLFRKQPEALNEWSLPHTEQCSLRQKKIVANCLPALKENGILFYSTCSYSVNENEEVVEFLTKTFDLEILRIKIEPEWGIEENDLGYRFYPYNLDGEGFFCSVLRKKGSESGVSAKGGSFLKIAGKNEQAIIKELVDISEAYELAEFKGEYRLISRNANECLKQLGKSIYIKHAGTPVGELKHNSLIPHHFLSLSVHLRENIPVLELSREEALRFLKKEYLEPREKTGLVLVAFQSYGIGWAKILPNRVNNYLPAPYTIFNKEIGM